MSDMPLALVLYPKLTATPDTFTLSVGGAEGNTLFRIGSVTIPFPATCSGEREIAHRARAATKP